MNQLDSYFDDDDNVVMLLLHAHTVLVYGQGGFGQSGDWLAFLKQGDEKVWLEGVCCLFLTKYT